MPSFSRGAFQPHPTPRSTPTWVVLSFFNEKRTFSVLNGLIPFPRRKNRGLISCGGNSGEALLVCCRSSFTEKASHPQVFQRLQLAAFPFSRYFFEKHPPGRKFGGKLFSGSGGSFFSPRQNSSSPRTSLRRFFLLTSAPVL